MTIKTYKRIPPPSHSSLVPKPTLTVAEATAPPVAPAVPFARGGTVLTPTAPQNIIVWQAPFPCTVSAVKGYASGATGTKVNARKNGSLNHLPSDLTLSSPDTWLDGGTVQNVSYAIGDKMEIMLTAISGSPTEIAVQVDCTKP